jgi:hypothetical protein
LAVIDKELFAHAIGVQPPRQIKEVRMDLEAQRVEVDTDGTFESRTPLLQNLGDL